MDEEKQTAPSQPEQIQPEKPQIPEPPSEEIPPEETPPTPPKKRPLPWRRYAMFLCLAIFLISGALLVRDLTQSSKEQEANHNLAQRVRQAKLDLSSGDDEAFEEEEPPPKYAPNGNLFQYDALWQENHDLAGWLRIPGTDVDLPVMNNPADPEFYLRRAFDGSRATSGCLFLNEGYRPDGNFAIIYGHNMNNGTMFGELDQYRSADYAKEHPTVCFDTLTEEREYTVLAAFNGKVYRQNDTGVFRYYQYRNFDDEAEFDEFLSQVRRIALYDTGVETHYGDQIVVLSTCSYHQKNGRFVVVACRTPEPDPEADSAEESEEP